MFYCTVYNSESLHYFRPPSIISVTISHHHRLFLRIKKQFSFWVPASIGCFVKSKNIFFLFSFSVKKYLTDNAQRKLNKENILLKKAQCHIEQKLILWWRFFHGCRSRPEPEPNFDPVPEIIIRLIPNCNTNNSQHTTPASLYKKR